MRNKALFYKYETIRTLKKVLHIKSSSDNLPTRLGNRETMTPQETSTVIEEAIRENQPFFVGRFGGFELAVVIKYLEGRIDLKSNLIEHFQTNAGFFKNDNLSRVDIEAFSKLYLDAATEVDVIGRFWIGMENYIIEAYSSKAQLSKMFYLEPWYPGIDNPWSASLAGKKVLVIHPFEKTIKLQYEKRNSLFPNTQILPDFDLITMKAVQTIAGTKDDRFENWFQALDFMYLEAMKIDFDVAILGCGAYGFPLAAKLKAAGKTAIHLGGATQLLFGIKGKRWEDNNTFKYVQELFNDSWIYPLKEDCISGSSKVEGGCYWGTTNS